MMVFDDLLKINEDLWSYLSKTDKNIVMYGTGNGADKIIDVFENKGIKLYGIFASDDFARGQNFRGFTVKKYSDFVNELEDFIVVVSFASQRDEVLENIYKIASERELYAPDVPVFGDGLFDLEYFNQNVDKLRYVYSKLADDLSRKTFISTIAFKITGNISYLKDCETTEEEINSLITYLIRNKNYIDIGAYTGDTVEKYVNLFGDSMTIYAIEPDEKNYRKMLERFKDKGISCKTFNVAGWDKTELLKFYAKSGRASTVNNSNNSLKYKEIQGQKIDEIIEDSIGYIKIDAEGADCKVIEGLTETIKNNLPCMKIAAYHRNEDYFSIPLTVDKINSEYRLYMRHLKYVPGWDTDFIFDFSNN